MEKMFKNLCNKFFVNSLWEIFKYIWPAFPLSAELYMIHGWLEAALVFIGLVGILFIFQSWFNFYRKIENSKKQIDGKIIFLEDGPPRIYVENKKLYISIVVNIYNCSSQIVSYIIDTKKTRVDINDNTKSPNKCVYITTSWLTPPCFPSYAATDYVALDLESITTNTNLEINAEIYLKYGVKGDEKYEISKQIQTCYKVIDKGNNHIILIPSIKNSL